jgi:hypothetical protein
MKRVENVAKICTPIAFFVFLSKILKPRTVPDIRQFKHGSHWFTTMTARNSAGWVYNKEALKSIALPCSLFV